MKEITFPQFNLKIEVNNIAFNIGGIDIYWYAIFIVTAFIIAILGCKKDDGKYNVKFDTILELIIIVIPIAIISARLYYILFKIQYYIKNPIEIFNIRNGGLAIYGGLIGSVITIVIYCKKKNINVLDILDYVVPYLALGQSIGRWGNFFNREAHGIVTDSIFRMGIIENGKYIEVHPTFLYESVCSLVIFIILYNIKDKRKYKGQIAFIYLTTYGLVRAIIECLRTDSLMIGDFRVSQILSIILFVIFGGILIYKKIKRYVQISS